MEIAHLKTFVAVAEHASFSVAAKQLFLTQPAVSKRIATLEQQLGTRLLDRTSAQVTLTEAGQTLLSRARRILSEVNNTVDEIRSLDHDIGGRLRVGTSHHIGIHRLPPVLRTFTNNFSAVELDLSFLDSELACEHVQNGQLELAVVTLPPMVPSALLTEIIWPDPLAIVIPVGHALSGKKAYEPGALSDYPAILPSVGTITRSILETKLAPCDVTIDVALETNYLETIKMMVSVGLGWSVLPLSMLSEELAVVNIPKLQMHRMLGTVRLRNRSLSRAATGFAEVLSNYKPAVAAQAGAANQERAR